MTSKHIGIVACSAEGAALCYRTICVEGAELLGEHSHPEVTMHTYPLARYLEVFERDGWEGVVVLVRKSASILRSAGAELLICPDNTIHPAVEEVRSESRVPWLHIAEEVTKVAAERGYTKVGVLGTKILMEGGVYAGKLAEKGIVMEIPEEWERGEIDAAIFDELVYGHFEENTRTRFQEIIRELADKGCDAVVLGCTEIPLLIRPQDSSLPVLDSTRVLARAALREAMGEVLEERSHS